MSKNGQLLRFVDSCPLSTFELQIDQGLFILYLVDAYLPIGQHRMLRETSF